MLAHRAILTVAVTLLLAAAAGCPSSEGPAADTGREAPTLEIAEWIKGDPVTIEGLRGKVVVVEFWATWCPPCARSVPHLTGLQEQYADQVVVIGITDESADTVNKWLADNPDIRIGYTVAQDQGGRTTAAYKQGNPYIPEAFLVDTRGVIVWRGHPMGQLDQRLARLLAEGGSGAPNDGGTDGEPAGGSPG